MSVTIILLICALVCWFLAAIPVPVGAIQIGWLGMFFYGLTILLG